MGTNNISENRVEREKRLLDVIRALVVQLGGGRSLDAVQLNCDLESALGIGSLERVELLARIESALGVHLPDAAAESRTPEELLGWIERSASSPEFPGISKSPPAGDPPPVRSPSRTKFESIPRSSTLGEALLSWADRDPDRTHAHFREGENDESTITYGELATGALRLGAEFRRRGIGPGDTVGLMLPTGKEFLTGFFGTLFAGGIPVPLYPPLRTDRAGAFADRQRAIFANAGLALLITGERDEPLEVLLRQAAPEGLAIASARELQSLPASDRVDPGAGKESEAAFLQYTSGSTSHPKGVLLDHRAVLANIRAIGEAVEIRESDSVVSWLPLYHDMGLVGSWLFALVHGVPITLLPPASFLVRPERWLRAIHDHRGTLSAAPNFAYELAARRVPEEVVDEIDLSSWREALSGSEPVLPGTLNAFCGKFERSGFRRSCFRPVYGLAESAVALAFPPSGRGPAIELIDRGRFESAREAELAVPGSAHPARRFVSVVTALP